MSSTSPNEPDRDEPESNEPEHLQGPHGPADPGQGYPQGPYAAPPAGYSQGQSPGGPPQPGFTQGPYGAPPPGYGPGQSPYGAPQPGYGQDPSYYGAPGQPGAPWNYAPSAPPGRSNTAKFWIGAALSIPGLVAVGFITGALGNAATYVDPTFGSIVTLGLGMAVFVAVVVGAVVQKTRWYAIGVIAAFGVLAILAAGACIVLIASLTGAF